MARKRVRHPLVSFLMFLVLIGLGWLAYELIHVRGMLRPEEVPVVPQEVREEVETMLERDFGMDPCFHELSDVDFRPREGRWRIAITVRDGCADDARTLCAEIGNAVKARVDAPVSVWAYDLGGSELTHWVD